GQLLSLIFNLRSSILDPRLNYTQPFAGDAVWNDSSPGFAQSVFDFGFAPPLAIEGHASASARAADLGRFGAGHARDLDQSIDEWSGNSGGEVTAAGPFFGEDRADPGERARSQGVVDLEGSVANALEPVEHAGGVVDVALVHLPVIDAGIARRAGETERHSSLQFVEVGHDLFARHAFDPQLDARNSAVHRREIVLIAGGDFQDLRLDVDRDDRKSLRAVAFAGQPVERPANGDVESRRSRQPRARRRHAIRADVQPGRRFEETDQFGDE